PICQVEVGGPSWITPIKAYLMHGSLLNDKDQAKRVRSRAGGDSLIGRTLYKRAVSMPYLRGLEPCEVDDALVEVKEGICGSRTGGRTLAHKLIRHGVYWSTLKQNCME